MRLSRRSFLGGLGMLAGTTALGSLIRPRKARAAGATNRVIVVGIGGGLRLNESLGMAQGATMPNLFGTTPLVTGFATGSQGAPKIAPEYAATATPLALPAVRSTPLFTQGTLITNLRYADGPPGHLQGHGCLMSGFYNQLENRADARLPEPTIFELHRKEAATNGTDAFYVSRIGGFYRALISSNNPDFGPDYAGIYLEPPDIMQPLVPVITSGERTLNITSTSGLPIIPFDPDEDAAAAKLTAVLDANTPAFAADDPVVHATTGDNARVQQYLAQIFSDPTYASFFDQKFGIGMRNTDGSINATNDALTIFHAERVLQQFKPSVMGVTLLDIDVCHTDYNGYLRAQQLADACVSHLWDFIQSDPDLADSTTMLVLPEHGRHLFFNGVNPDSLGRSGLDHGQGDDGDRNVWVLALGRGIKPNNGISPTGIQQSGRSSGRYETIDAIMTGMSLLGHDQAMTDELNAFGARPGLVMQEVLS